MYFSDQHLYLFVPPTLQFANVFKSADVTYVVPVISTANIMKIIDSNFNGGFVHEVSATDHICLPFAPKVEAEKPGGIQIDCCLVLCN